MQKAELFCPKPRIHGADTGDVAAGPIKAGHDAGLDWVCAGHEHDRNCHRCRFGRESRCYAARRGDDGHPPAYQIGRQFRQRIAFAVRPAIFDDNVTSLHVADFRKPFAERRREFRVWFGGTLMEKADHRHLWLLRARRERPRGCRAAKQRDERATLHSITSSAIASRDGGTSRPSVLAVLKLMTSSYFVGACTGRSAGYSPLRMRSTYPAARRYGSVALGP